MSRVALVRGGSRGIGAQVARRLSDDGFKVVGSSGAASGYPVRRWRHIDRLVAAPAACQIRLNS